MLRELTNKELDFVAGGEWEANGYRPKFGSWPWWERIPGVIYNHTTGVFSGTSSSFIASATTDTPEEEDVEIPIIDVTEETRESQLQEMLNRSNSLDFIDYNNDGLADEVQFRQDGKYIGSSYLTGLIPPENTEYFFTVSIPIGPAGLSLAYNLANNHIYIGGEVGIGQNFTFGTTANADEYLEGAGMAANYGIIGVGYGSNGSIANIIGVSGASVGVAFDANDFVANVAAAASQVWQGFVEWSYFHAGQPYTPRLVNQF